MRSAEQFEAARRLIEAGVNDCAIARQLGVPRPTVRDWRCRPQTRPRLARGSGCGVVHDFSALPAAPYCYVLGLYLGDGCISRNQRVWRLRITLDKKYPGIIERCRDAIDMLMPGQRASVQKQPKGCVAVSLYSKHWPCLLPQHGPGKKHQRLIRLDAWQQVLVKQGKTSLEDEFVEVHIFGPVTIRTFQKVVVTRNKRQPSRAKLKALAEMLTKSGVDLEVRP